MLLQAGPQRQVYEDGADVVADEVETVYEDTDDYEYYEDDYSYDDTWYDDSYDDAGYEDATYDETTAADEDEEDRIDGEKKKDGLLIPAVTGRTRL